MTTTQNDARAAADEAMRVASEAAIEWLRANGRWCWGQRLAEEAVPRVKAALREGLAEARETTEALGGDTKVAMTSLKARLAQAGIEAAKAAAETGPKPTFVHLVG